MALALTFVQYQKAWTFKGEVVKLPFTIVWMSVYRCEVLDVEKILLRALSYSRAPLDCTFFLDFLLATFLTLAREFFNVNVLSHTSRSYGDLWGAHALGPEVHCLTGIEQGNMRCAVLVFMHLSSQYCLFEICMSG